MDKKSEKNGERKTEVENAATSYGLEDHEATQQDPRVEELRAYRSKHEKDNSLTTSRTLIKTSRRQSKTAEALVRNSKVDSDSETEVQQKTVNYNNEIPQLVACPQKTQKQPQDQDQTQPQTTPPTICVSPKRLQEKDEGQSSKNLQDPEIVPIAAKNVEDNKNEPKTSGEGISKVTNTDVSFDPTKTFASKTTNTLDDPNFEDNLPPPPLVTKATNTQDDPSVDANETQPPVNPKTKPDLNMDDCFAFAVELVKRAGALALFSNQSRLSYTTKEHAHDLNTRADNEVEELIVSAINAKYPDHKIIAEEAVSSSETAQVVLTDEPTWIIDPIDGTMNYVHHFPYYCISVALLVEKQTSFGIVFNPPLKQMYTARKGEGAKLNGETMQTSGQASLTNALVLQEYSSGMNEDRAAVSMENAKRLIKKTHALRSIGSSAMGLAMVASGVADGFYFFGLHVWDMAAGNILVTESGGTVIDPAGGVVDIMSRRVLAAATQTLAFDLSAELIQNYPSPRDDQPKLPDPTAYSEKKDFNVQTEFSDTSFSVDSRTSNTSIKSTPKQPK